MLTLATSFDSMEVIPRDEFLFQKDFDESSVVAHDSFFDIPPHLVASSSSLDTPKYRKREGVFFEGQSARVEEKKWGPGASLLPSLAPPANNKQKLLQPDTQKQSDSPQLCDYNSDLFGEKSAINSLAAARNVIMRAEHREVWHKKIIFIKGENSTNRWPKKQIQCPGRCKTLLTSHRIKRRSQLRTRPQRDFGALKRHFETCKLAKEYAKSVLFKEEASFGVTYGVNLPLDALRDIKSQGDLFNWLMVSRDRFKVNIEDNIHKNYDPTFRLSFQNPITEAISLWNALEETKKSQAQTIRQTWKFKFVFHGYTLEEGKRICADVLRGKCYKIDSLPRH